MTEAMVSEGSTLEAEITAGGRNHIFCKEGFYFLCKEGDFASDAVIFLSVEHR